jgi:hypothetical protein
MTDEKPSARYVEFRRMAGEEANTQKIMAALAAVGVIPTLEIVEQKRDLWAVLALLDEQFAKEKR